MTEFSSELLFNRCINQTDKDIGGDELREEECLNITQHIN